MGSIIIEKLLSYFSLSQMTDINFKMSWVHRSSANDEVHIIQEGTNDFSRRYKRPNLKLFLDVNVHSIGTRHALAERLAGR